MNSPKDYLTDREKIEDLKRFLTDIYDEGQIRIKPCDFEHIALRRYLEIRDAFISSRAITLSALLTSEVEKEREELEKQSYKKGFQDAQKMIKGQERERLLKEVEENIDDWAYEFEIGMLKEQVKEKLLSGLQPKRK